MEGYVERIRDMLPVPFEEAPTFARLEAMPFNLPEKADPWVVALAIPWTNLEGMLRAEGII